MTMPSPAFSKEQESMIACAPTPQTDKMMNSKTEGDIFTIIPVEDDTLLCDRSSGSNKNDSPPAVMAKSSVPGGMHRSLSSPLLVREENEKPVKARMKRSISFGEIQIQEYNVTVGVNPSVRAGVPIEMDWKPVSSIAVGVDNFEDSREGNRRSMLELLMSSRERESKLRDLGYSRSEMNWGLKQANIARRKRQTTLETMSSSKLHEWSETIVRKARHVVTLGKQKREFRRLSKEISGPASQRAPELEA